ncbi:hypothetical protein ACGFR8_31480 [Streptomyces brevispora]|uniref:hypothetical protein n=1 Tax=Streptomyces brevispora TaxID=887462 RepID=UPI003723F3C7
MTMNTPTNLRTRATELEGRVPPIIAGPRTNDERMWLEKAAALRAEAAELEGPTQTGMSVVAGLFEESNLRPSLMPTYTAAVGALFDRDAAARLRAAGFVDAATFLEPDQAVIDEAFGPEPADHP